MFKPHILVLQELSDRQIDRDCDGIGQGVNGRTPHTDHVQFEPLDIPIGIPDWIFSIKALFKNCSSASTRVVFMGNEARVQYWKRLRGYGLLLEIVPDLL